MAEYKNLYYQYTINKVNGEYVYITYIERGYLEGVLCKNGENVCYKEFVIESLNNVRVGMINTFKGIVTLNRFPKRSAKEGISIESVGYSIDGYKYEIYRALINDYPTLDEAYTLAEYNNFNVAFSKDEYVTPDGEVYNNLGLKKDRYVLV